MNHALHARLTTWAALAAAAALAIGAAPSAHADSAAGPSSLPILPRLVGVSASHHAGFDRLLLTFDREATPPTSATWATAVYGDPSGHAIPVPGRALLRVVIRGADAHTYAGRPTAVLDQALPLPGLVSLRKAGDYEGVITLGVGVALRTSFRVHALPGTATVALDVSTAFARTSRPVWFGDGRPHIRVSPLQRYVLDGSAAAGLLDRLFAGTTAAEQSQQHGFAASGATGFSKVTVSESRVARVYLVGECDTGWWGTRPDDLPGLVRIQNEIIPTLKALPTVDWVKIYDARGTTRRPTGPIDSYPDCLFP